VSIKIKGRKSKEKECCTEGLDEAGERIFRKEVRLDPKRKKR